MDILVELVIGKLTKRRVMNYLRQNLDDLLNPYFWIEVVVEFLLCAFTLTIVIWALTTVNPAAYKPSTTHFGLFAGFVIMALIEGWGPLCGAPLNPSGTWGFFVAGRISLVRAIFYMGAEISGAAAGGMIGIRLTPPLQASEFQPILPGPEVTAGQGLAIEGILTFNLLIVALSCTNPKTKSAVFPSFPIAFCIGTGIMAAGTHTGGLQNPIVPFGPAVATNKFQMHFEVYWAGPFIGATIAAIFYTIVITLKEHLTIHRFLPEEPKTEENKRNTSIEVVSITKRESRPYPTLYHDNTPVGSKHVLVTPAISSAEISPQGSVTDFHQHQHSNRNDNVAFSIEGNASPE